MKGIIAAAFLFVTSQSADLERLTKDLLDTELVVEKTMYRVVQCESEGAGLADFAARQAEKIGIASFAAKPIEGSEPVAGAPLLVRRFDISGSGELYDAHRLLRHMALERNLRTFDIESLQMSAAAGGTVRFSARIAEVCRSQEESRPPRVVDEIETMYRQRLQELRAFQAAMVRLDESMRPQRLTGWIAALDDEWGEQLIRLSELRYVAPRLTVEGVAVGSLAKASLERHADVQWASAGDCRSFTASARLPEKDFEEHNVAAKEIFDERTKALCTPSSQPRAKITIARGSGELTLHARDIEIRSVFRVLHEIMPTDGYVVAPDVTGRVDIDVDQATLAEVLDALRAARVANISAGPLHRVCKSECGASTDREFQGEPISVAVNGTEVGDVLRALTDALQVAEIHVPPDMHGTIAVFAQEVAGDRLLDAIIVSMGQTYTTDGRRIFVGDPSQRFRSRC
jgi:hypothetical protein